MLIYYYTSDELSYDTFHEKYDRIYRINQTNIWSIDEVPFASTGPNVDIAIEAVIIICLGLLGFVAFRVECRNKEMGVRNVLGAIVFNIVQFLSVDLIRWIITGFVISIPLAYVIMHY